MELIKTGIEDLLVFQPKIWGDERGYFFEAFHQGFFNECAGKEIDFVQDNQSFSTKGVLRGLHFQQQPFAQGKLVRVIKGKVLDVAVDLRLDSKTFGKSYSIVLDADKNNMMYIPEGFGHGFYTIEDAVFFYKCTNYYNKETEGGLIWNDPSLGINWGESITPVVSDKDLILPSLEELTLNLKSEKIIL